MNLESIIKDRIRARGPMSVAEYMELALAHHEHGYYMRGDPLGAQGDFITAPEISQIFGELIGAWLAQQWLAMGRPEAILAELGPGRGTLMDDALRATKHVAGFHESISVHLVESSPALRHKQQEKLAGRHPSIHWHARFDELPQKPLLLVANEFFDALPIRQFVCPSLRGEAEAIQSISKDNSNGKAGLLPLRFSQGRNDGATERMIDLKDERLMFLSDPIAGEEIRETCEAGIAIAAAIGAHIAMQDGAALIIDYGYTGGSRGDTLQALKSHRYHPVLEQPGSADLTAHVDFDALAQAAREGGATIHGPARQGDFLLALGARERLAALAKNATAQQKSAMHSALQRLTSPEHMGELFKVLCIAHPQQPTPEGFSVISSPF